MTRAEYLKKHIKVGKHSFQTFDWRIKHTSSDCVSTFAAENTEYVWFQKEIRGKIKISFWILLNFVMVFS